MSVFSASTTLPQPHLVTVGLWRLQRLEDFLCADPIYEEIDAGGIPIPSKGVELWDG